MMGNNGLAVVATLLVFALVGPSSSFARSARSDSVDDIVEEAVTTEEIETTSEYSEMATNSKQKKVNCNSQNFERTADECCLTPAADIFPLETAQLECNKKQDKKGDSLLNGVMLNKLQKDSKKNYQLDYSGNLIGRIFGPGVCFADCIFKSNGLMTPEGNIDYGRTTEYVTMNRTEPWRSILTEAVAICKNFSETAAIQEITFKEKNTKKTCKTESVHVVQCLQAVITLNCPQDLPYEHDKHKKCGESVNNLQTCVGHIHNGIVRTESLKKYLTNKKAEATEMEV